MDRTDRSVTLTHKVKSSSRRESPRSWVTENTAKSCPGRRRSEFLGPFSFGRTRTAAHPDVGAVFKVQALQLRSSGAGSLQAFDDLRPADVQTLGEIHTLQGRQGQKVGEACGQQIFTIVQPAFGYITTSFILLAENWSYQNRAVIRALTSETDQTAFAFSFRLILQVHDTLQSLNPRAPFSVIRQSRDSDRCVSVLRPRATASTDLLVSSVQALMSSLWRAGWCFTNTSTE